MTETATAAATACPYGSGAALDGRATLADARIIAHPDAFYRAMRRDDPVHHDPELNLYLVSRHEDVEAVLKDSTTFSVKKGFEEQYAKGFAAEFNDILRRDGGGYFRDGIMSDPPEHTRIRRLLENAFTAHRVRVLEPEIRAIAVDLIEGFADRGRCDGMNDFASPFTIRVICKQMGMKDVDAAKIHGWSASATAQIGRLQDREQMLHHAAQYCEMQNAVIDLIRARQQEPGEDMVSDLVQARLPDQEEERLTFEELVSLGRVLLVGGNDNTTGAVSALLMILATQPRVLEELRANLDDSRWMNRFVEEAIRIGSSARGTARMTMREVELGGKLLPKGAHLLLLYGSANGDEAKFDSPATFDAGRANLMTHLAFGAGVHRCVGVALARMEMKVAAQEIGRRLADIRLAVAPDAIECYPTIANFVPRSLPLTFRRV